MIIQESREVNNADGQLIQKKLGQPPLAFFEYGDYLLRGDGVTCLVERVTNSGLLSDIESGRMTSKLEGCAEDADIVLLLVEGLILPARDGSTLLQKEGYTFNYYDLKGGHFPEGADLRMSFRRTGFRFASVQNFLVSCQLRGVNLISTLSPSDTAETLLDLDRYFSKHEHPLPMTRPHKFSFTRDKNHELLYLVEGLPGIGHERAKLLTEIFGTPLAVFTASENQLKAVPGIGKTIAHKIYETLRRQCG